MNHALSKNQRIIITLLFLALMIITRGYHGGSAIHLPDASPALFFLAGLYLRDS